LLLQLEDGTSLEDGMRELIGLLSFRLFGLGTEPSALVLLVG